LILAVRGMIVVQSQSLQLSGVALSAALVNPPKRSESMYFHSSLTIDPHEKVEIVLKLLESSRSQVMTWHNQAYVSTTSSLSLILLVTKLWVNAWPKTLV